MAWDISNTTWLLEISFNWKINISSNVRKVTHNTDKSLKSIFKLRNTVEKEQRWGRRFKRARKPQSTARDAVSCNMFTLWRDGIQSSKCAIQLERFFFWAGARLAVFFQLSCTLSSIGGREIFDRIGAKGSAWSTKILFPPKHTCFGNIDSSLWGTWNWRYQSTVLSSLMASTFFGYDPWHSVFNHLGKFDCSMVGSQACRISSHLICMRTLWSAVIRPHATLKCCLIRDPEMDPPPSWLFPQLKKERLKPPVPWKSESVFHCSEAGE